MKKIVLILVFILSGAVFFNNNITAKNPDSLNKGRIHLTKPPKMKAPRLIMRHETYNEYAYKPYGHVKLSKTNFFAKIFESNKRASKLHKGRAVSM
jgi:hypothetical protein